MSLFNQNEFNDLYNNLIIFSNKNTGLQKKKINTVSPQINNNISEFKILNNENINKNLSITGDRFIPFKNNLDNNIQNFILNSSPLNNNSSFSKQKIDSNSSSESKPEKNYVNFIIDNMLKNSSDDFIIRNNGIKRKNNIFSFSKSIYNTTSKYKPKININNNDDIDINKKNLNLSAKHKKDCTNDKLINENINKDINFDFYNNIDNFIEYNKKRIITPDNSIFKYENKYNKLKRKIQKTPIRILDAPNLIDDFYLNLLDWGKENIIAVALSDEIYLWNDNNCQTSLLMSYENKNNNNNDEYNNNITSLSWMNNGICLGVGLPDGSIQLWDINKRMKLREIKAHENRISCLAWNEYILSSGSKDKVIKNFDVRIKDSEISKIKKHKQEICSLKYSVEGDLLASGGNDNIAYIWDIRNLKNNIFNFLFDESNIFKEIKPYSVNNFHNAAIKAMNWCPWKRHILATGGGSKDKTIKIFSCDYNKLLKSINTGSQVCSIIWNKKEKELISSHGYNKNQIIIWNYEKDKKVCELKGHMNRVLYLTFSPDERFICSGSGDETLRFWKINNEQINNNEIEERDSLINNVLIH